MDSDLKWIAGLAVTVLLAFVGTLIGVFRNLAARISSGNRDIYQKIDEIKEKYVRRDDLNSHIKRLEGGIQDLRAEMREQNRQVLEAISNSNRKNDL